MKKIVVDANVARSAGENSDRDPTSSSCRLTLQAIEEGAFQIVLGAELYEEWRRHQSVFTRVWLTRMTSQNRISSYESGSEECRSIKNNLQAAIPMREIYKIVEKDYHLIEAAIVTDKLIISVETHSRDHYRMYSNVIQVLQEICLMNPADPEEKVVAWLKAGAKHSDCRKLVPHDPTPRPRRRKPKDR